MQKGKGNSYIFSIKMSNYLLLKDPLPRCPMFLQTFQCCPKASGYCKCWFIFFRWISLHSSLCTLSMHKVWSITAVLAGEHPRQSSSVSWLYYFPMAHSIPLQCEYFCSGILGPTTSWGSLVIGPLRSTRDPELKHKPGGLWPKMWGIPLAL